MIYLFGTTVVRIFISQKTSKALRNWAQYILAFNEGLLFIVWFISFGGPQVLCMVTTISE